jgi:hypothetical protein
MWDDNKLLHTLQKLHNFKNMEFENFKYVQLKIWNFKTSRVFNHM